MTMGEIQRRRKWEHHMYIHMYVGLGEAGDGRRAKPEASLGITSRYTRFFRESGKTSPLEH